MAVTGWEVTFKFYENESDLVGVTMKDIVEVENLNEATAIITNPTHFAIALKYEVGESSAPKIISKGRGKVAEKIIEESKKLNLGKIESPILARALYYTGEIGEEVISQLYNAVAVALAYIYKIDRGEFASEPEIIIPEDMQFNEQGELLKGTKNNE